jgi:trimethylamine---corrinoid protein Co-methyltransferase
VCYLSRGAQFEIKVTGTDGSIERRSRRRPTARDSLPVPDNRAGRYRHLANPFAPVRVISDDQVESIHVAALGLLETDGMRVLSTEARTRLAAAGAEVDEGTQTVRLDRALVETALTTAPGHLELRALDPQRNARIGGPCVAIAPVAGPPNVTDLERGRRPGSLSAFQDFVKLSQSFDVIHLLGPCVEPQDIAVQDRHLEVTLAQLTLADKVPWVFCRGHRQISDCLEMIRIAHRREQHQFREGIYTYTVINTNSPRQLDIPMAEGIIDFAEAGQLTIVTPFTLSGAMAPVTIAGALTLAHMEALFGITLAQIVRPGAPVMYGTFTSNVDMKSGSPAFGTPEFTKACFAAGQLARRVGIPWRSSSATAANMADAQSAYEAEMSLWGALLAGCNVLLHGAGWLESGLSASYEKFILDIEMLQMFAELFQPLAADADERAADAIREVEPGGHFFAAAHTMQRYKTAFYQPLVSDWRNFGQWSEAGGKSVTERAVAVWKATLDKFVAPARDPSIIEELTAYIARRKSEGGAPPVT